MQSAPRYSCANQTESNPFLTEFQTPNGVPPFDKIKLEHYEPAFLKGIEEQNANIQAIIDNTEVPSFENVIVALDNSSPILNRVGAIFFNMTDAETNDSLNALSIKLAPVLSEHEDNISLNQKLFDKVKAGYLQKDSLGLTTEQQRLLDKTYKDFVRSGANLSAEKQARLREVNKQLSTLGKLLLAELPDKDSVLVGRYLSGNGKHPPPCKLGVPLFLHSFGGVP